MRRSNALLGVASLMLGVVPASARPINLTAPLASPSAIITVTPARSLVEPPLPTPPIPTTVPSKAFLTSARSAVMAARTGEAREALEQAETRQLSGPSTPGERTTSVSDRIVLDIRTARADLTARDRTGALHAIDDALGAIALAEQPQPLPPLAAAFPPVMAVPAVPPAPPPPPQPMITYALLPGHWQLQGAQQVWVPPETRLRRVEERTWVQGRHVWRGGAWQWVPAHYAD